MRPDAGPVALQVAALGGFFILAALMAFGGIAWFASLVGVVPEFNPRTTYFELE